MTRTISQVHLDEDWLSLTGIHGGHLASISARAAAAKLPDRQVRTITSSFLTPARPGPAEVVVEEVRAGRSLAVVTVELLQESRSIVTSRLTLVTQRDGHDWACAWNDAPRRALPPVEACVPIHPPEGIRHVSQAVGRLDPAHLPFSDSGEGRVRGHVRPLDPAGEIDAPWLAMVVDWFPPAAFTMVAPPVGGVSIDLTTHIHRTHRPLGSDDWLGASFEVATSAGGLALEHGWVAAPDGSLLAESFHTRWTARD